MSSEPTPIINYNPPLQRYYHTLESRIGYKLFLDNTRHFGYYSLGTYWPFPIDGALRAMEDHVFRSLELKPGAEVLDAGCGVGHVAIRFARKGVHVQAIDVVDHHIRKAQRSKHISNVSSIQMSDTRQGFLPIDMRIMYTSESKERKQHIWGRVLLIILSEKESC